MYAAIQLRESDGFRWMFGNGQEMYDGNKVE